MRRIALLILAPALAASCSFFAETPDEPATRARAAERAEPSPLPVPTRTDDDVSVPFDTSSGLPEGGVSRTLPRSPDMDEVPHADPELVMDDLEDRLMLNQALAARAHDLAIDWRDGALILEGVVDDQR